MKDMNKVHDLTGQRFGRLSVIGISDTNTRKTYWVCQCDCGNVKEVRSDSLLCGAITSCGCRKKEQDRKNLTANHSHKKSGTRIYKEWLAMRRRCNNPNDKCYHRWGGRGIKVCDEWDNSFQNFYDWAIANGYSDNLTIDRIDNDGNYEPSNCRWVSNRDQCNNRSSNIKITIGCATKTLIQWCEIFKLDYRMVHARYHRNNVSSLDSLFAPSKYRGKQNATATVERRG